MNIIFAGTPDFASTALKALLDQKRTVSLCLTQPDRPSGRGMKLTPPPVKILAQKNHIQVLQPLSLKLDGKSPDDAQKTYQTLKALAPDIMIVVAYGLILPRHILELPKLGCLNIHPSLLPRWRGAAPIQRALQAGDSETGVCIMQMDEGLDTGPILKQEKISIAPFDTAGTLHDKLADLGAKLLCQTLDELQNGHKTVTPQTTESVSYATKILKEEAVLNFQLTAEQLAYQIRAFNPFPGCNTTFDKTPLKIWNAIKVDYPSATPGQLLKVSEEGILVACKKDALLLTELQRPGNKRLPAHEFIKGFSFKEGFFS